jgi:uncharacterized protein (TIGR03790 family)
MIKVWFVFLALALAPFLVRAGGDEVVVVYNKNMPESRTVADNYARLRQVPPKQVYGFALPVTENISRADFRDLLQVPLAEKLEASGLWKFGLSTFSDAKGGPPQTIKKVIASKIRYAVLCYGVPLRIDADPTIKEDVDPAIPALFQNNGASVDSELVWLPLIQNKIHLAAFLKNWVYGATNTALLNPTNGILLVTRLDGPSADIAMGLVSKSLQAERDGLWGRAYFDARGITDPHYKLGDEWILDSAELCRDLGYETVVDDNPDTFPADFPMSHIAIYAGWYSGNADGPFAQPTVEFMPGAFAYHLHSYSAATLRSTTVNWCGPLLAKGVTCIMGCVDEPSLQFTPNVALFLSRWTVSRFTFGEAAWAAQPVLSWQTTVIGDPLYRPFGQEPDALSAELKQKHSPLLEWVYLRGINVACVRGVPYSQLEEFLENLTNTQSSAILTEKMADFCQIQGKPESAIDYYQQALALNPSPEQAIRIRLALGKEYTDQNDYGNAIVDYQRLLGQFPRYPGWDAVNAKIAVLQQKMRPSP